MNLVGTSFSFQPTTKSSVLEHLEDINPSKSAGIDNLAGKFLKEGAPVLPFLVTDLCNLFMFLSSFPDDCKIAKQKPFCNKDSKTMLNNYRPISLLLLISKIIEKIIHNQTQRVFRQLKIRSSVTINLAFTSTTQQILVSLT